MGWYIELMIGELLKKLGWRNEKKVEKGWARRQIKEMAKLKGKLILM